MTGGTPGTGGVGETVGARGGFETLAIHAGQDPDPLTGAVRYDNFNGYWGDQAQLDRFLQAYAVEKSRHSQCTCGYGPV